MRSQRMLPFGVRMRMARWPIANYRGVSPSCSVSFIWSVNPRHTFGSVLTNNILSSTSSCHQTLRWPFSFTSRNVVKTCPVAGTYCLGSSQILQESLPESLVTGYWVPHSLQRSKSSDVSNFGFADIVQSGQDRVNGRVRKTGETIIRRCHSWSINALPVL